MDDCLFIERQIFCHPTFYHVFLHHPGQVFPAEDGLVVESPPAAGAASGLLGVAIGSVEAEPPWSATGFSGPGRPTFVASPNSGSFPRCSSSVEVVGEECAGSSIDVLPNGDSCNHSSSRTECWNRKTGHSDSRPNRNYSSANDTSALPTDATTSHCRKICPCLRQERHRHRSQELRPPPEVRQIRWAEENRHLCLHLLLPWMKQALQVPVLTAMYRKVALSFYAPCSWCIPTADSGLNPSAGSDHAVLLVRDPDYSMVIRFFTSFTPFTSLASLVASLISAALPALPCKVTTPFFVTTLVLRALVER